MRRLEIKRIISIVETSNWRSVFISDEGEINVSEIDAIAVVELDPPDDSTEIVFVEYNHGYWYICEEASNFIGAIRRNEDPEIIFKEEIEKFKKEKGIS